MVIAVTGGPPRGDAVDQLAPVGQHDAARRRCAPPAAAAAPSSSGHRAARRGRPAARRRAAHRWSCRHDPDTCYRRRNSCDLPGAPFALHLRKLRGHGPRHGSRLTCQDEARRPRARQACAARCPDRAPGRRRVERDGRRLLSFSCNDYLNLSHHPAVKAAAHRGARAPRRRRRRLAPRHRQPSAVRRTGKPPRPAARAPRPPACSAPAISPMPASSRPWSAATTWS